MNWVARAALWAFLCCSAAAQTPEERNFFDRNDLREDFDILDTDGDGYVSIAEFRKGAKGVWDDDIGEFFTKYDTNSDGVLTFDEYSNKS